MSHNSTLNDGYLDGMSGHNAELLPPVAASPKNRMRFFRAIRRVLGEATFHRLSVSLGGDEPIRS